MSHRRFGVVLSVLAACGGGEVAMPDAGSPRDGSLPSPTPDGGTTAPDGGTTAPDGGTTAPDGGTTAPDAPSDDGCAAPPTGNWTGTTKHFAQGSGPYQANGVEVTWTLAGTEGCVDRYTPSGTAWVDNQGHVCEANYESSHAIAPTDGALTVDRATSPATYAMTGATSWQITLSCPDASTTTARSHWASHHGVIDGDVFGGGYRQAQNVYWEWRFTRVGADLPPPDGCAEVAEDTWTGTHTVTGPGTDDLVATVTWTRVSTEGCVDRLQPSGTATIVMQPQDPCAKHIVDPDEGAVEPGDGFLEIDRSTNPPTFVSQASVWWPVTVRCTHEDGTTESYSSTAGQGWDQYGPLDGDVVAGGLVRELTEHTWRLTR